MGGENVRETLKDFCGRTGETALLDQWDVARNSALTPNDISYGSKQKVWWRCGHGHTWQAAVHTRTGSSTGCPYCTGKRAWPGETDLATLHPDLAAQWHPTKNGNLQPDAVLPGSHRKVWWVCEQGHEWQAIVKSRTAGSGCPVCTNRELCPGDNDLASEYPPLAAQWHPTKNGALLPKDIVPGTPRKVWWICGKGHEWKSTVASRVAGCGCPICAGKIVVPGENDMASLFSDIAAQWYQEKNGKLSPADVSPYSNRRVWWRCELGHTWQAIVASRTTRDVGCPYCSGKKVLKGFNDLATRNPQVAAQWHPALNGNLTPEMVTPGSHNRAWWECPNGHVWKAVIYSRAGPQHSGCPVCAGMVSEKRQRRYATLETGPPVPAGSSERQGGV